MNLTNQQFASLYKPTLHPQPTANEVREMITIFAASRHWYNREHMLRELHPAVEDMLYGRKPEMFAYINDWREMLLEFPHVSKEDETKLAYTQSDDKGKRDIQTRTTLGKYLRRHMPDVPDHELRDFVAQYVIEGNCHISNKLDDIIRAVREGPDSCMKKSGWDEYDHPYRVYDPEFGWQIAWREQGGEIVGRALLMQDGEDKYFVRSYKRSSGGFSHSDEHLEAWLATQGYDHVSDWEGCKVARIEHNHGFVMPYIDGNAQDVDDCGSHMEICEYGEFTANETCGHTGERGDPCDSCGDHCDEDDLTGIGFYGDDARVCEHCLEHHYTYVHGRSGEQYYIQSDYAVHCESDDEYYDEQHLDYHDVVWSDYHSAYYLLDDVWRCEGSDDYYLLESETYYELDGDKYHADNLPEGYYVDDEGVLRHDEDEMVAQAA